jgi:hypothetical protein
MLPRYFVGPALLLLWQIAPVSVVQDPAGRLRLSFGATVGAYEERTLDCAGQVTRRQQVKFKAVGGEAEYQISPDWRLEVQGGSMSSDPQAGTIVVEPYEGAFGKAMVAYDGNVVGAGVGLALHPGNPWNNPSAGARLLPATFFRLGSRTGFQGVMETGGSAYPGGPPNLVRFGVGYEGGAGRGAAVRLSLAIQDFPMQGRSDPGTNLRVVVPVASGFDLGGGVSTHTGGMSGGVFGRVTIGGRYGGQ